ncbi:ABC transporter substrate-binding protein [Pseudothermotoga sp. U03pept]|uniref:ABC transporter substrate-binding protein n=1 Tax=Pseudothermotoga sp. U03pept TaxID=3447012 RepID=UPI003F08D789
MKLRLGIVIFLTLAILASAKTIELKFAFWGDELEARVVTQACEKFNKLHPNIKVVPMHIPQYLEKLSAMIASGEPPHLAYLVESRALSWAAQGILVDLNELLQKDADPVIVNKLPQLYWKFDTGKKLAGVSFAAEFMITYYNKDLFDKAKVPYPPTKPEEWTWDKFVETARKLTFDNKGRRPGEPGFDSKNIVQYGAAIGGGGTSPWVLYPLLWSNGGDIVSEDGKQVMLDSPATVEAIQKIYNLIYKDFAAIAPAAADAFPSLNVALQTGQVAMVLDGQWAMQEAAQIAKEEGLRFGVAPLPYMKVPVTGVEGTPIGIFKDAVKNDPEVLQAAWEFYKFIQNPDQVVEVIRSGLWQPTILDWYTKEEYISKWLNPEVHPKEYRDAVVNYYKYAKPYPNAYLKNVAEINTIVVQEMSRIFYGQEDITKVCKEAAAKIQPLVAGRYDK